ncbi:hypothetical protein CY34DRAFT_17153 [Suillus luteus UH-Slu-Lm8-n1]|uniref:Uncharacterized protein n=1 Tax=Suillus luteus UH-Slu-Lm8-n1 TaxID=930992 RepID=A0A0D0ALV2_9AGAM|nr:hypothetical protein CY34DRAFT_17153 [Suillus luteus UH-Slu-Lm8-n1]
MTVYAYLYDHESKKVFVLVKLDHEEVCHSPSDIASAKLALSASLGGVPRPSCDESVADQSPWLQVLNVVGVLNVPNIHNVGYDHPLFAVTPGDSDFLVETPYGRPSILGKPGPMWFLWQLLQASVPFNPPLPPNELSHSANLVFEDTSNLSHRTANEPVASTSGYSHSTHLAVAEQLPPAGSLTATDDTYLLDTILGLAPHIPFDIQSTTMMHLLDDNNMGWPAPNPFTGNLGEPGPSEKPSEVVSGEPAPIDENLALHPDLQWRDSNYLWGKLEPDERKKALRMLGKKPCCWHRVIELTKALILGSLLVGMHGNPFHISGVDQQRAITSSFLTALRIDGKTYTDLMQQPLTLKNGKQKTYVGWQVIHTHVHWISLLLSLPPNTFEQLVSFFENKASELRKIVKGAMTPLTGFCAEGWEREMMKRCLSELNSRQNKKVQEALTELVVSQLFRELFWVALLIPVEGLADEKRSGRVADLFPDELCASVGCVSQDTVGNLLTLIYHTMLLMLREGPNKESIDSYAKHEAMNEIIIAALSPMYANPKEFPKFTETVMSLPFIVHEHVLDMNPKTKYPRTHGRVMGHVVKLIDVTEPDDAPRRLGLPNNKLGFYCGRAFTDVFCSHSDFEALPSS